MRSSIGLKELLDLNIRELVPLGERSFLNADAYFYFRVIKSYSRDELQLLEELSKSKNASLPFRVLAKLRLEIRQKNVSIQTIEEVLQTVSNDFALNGEIYFVVAFAYEARGEHLISRDYYQKSFEAFDISNVKKKAIKALHNVVAAESRVNPERKLFVDYLYVAKEARRVNELGIAGLAYLNISREYQIIGAFEAALKFCNRAIKLMENDAGSLQSCLAIAHRAHLLVDLGRFVEAKIDFELASLSPYPEVQSALIVLENIFEKDSKKEVDVESLLPTWKERLTKSKDKVEILGTVENKLIAVLSEKSLDKFDLIKSIYGEDIELEKLENRLKVLINRVRKKRPGLIVYENGKYRLADDSYLNFIKLG